MCLEPFQAAAHHCRPVRELKPVKEKLRLTSPTSAVESNCSFKDILENTTSLALGF